ncbi:hypothetical protein KKJ04_20140 [Xenorhabdus bovienii]|uniref:hypothetical protein n=1 Tax=Xenorhabdus bovienii TaxID=40576 RepID=UPI0023B2B659|nr:hypothetical protein [Xenorhabdus bovienii]MDE9447793.1 hypothetical protein [Xenorhabdus bovienii]
MKKKIVPVNASLVIESLPGEWSNIKERMTESSATLKNKWTYMFIDTSEKSVSVTVFVSEGSLSQNKSIVVSKNSFATNEAGEIIRELMPLVDEWNNAIDIIKNRETDRKEILRGIISTAKAKNVSAIPSQSANSFRFKTGDDKHYGEVSEGVDESYSISIKKLSADQVKNIITLIAGGK